MGGGGGTYVTILPSQCQTSALTTCVQETYRRERGDDLISSGEWHEQFHSVVSVHKVTLGSYHTFVGWRCDWQGGIYSVYALQYSNDSRGLPATYNFKVENAM